MSAANMEKTRKISMRFATLSVLGAALALVPAAGSLRAQINPNTALNSAKAGAQTAQAAGQDSANQTQSQTKKQQPAAKSAGQSTSTATKSTATKPAPVRPNSTYLPGASKNKNTASTNNQTQGTPKAVPVAARPTPAAPAPAPAVSVPKPHADPMMKVATVSNRRDPFSSLIGRETKGGVGHDIALPPGKAGLQVESLIIQGLVRGPNGMIAVVENPQQRVYFLHEGDSLFDGKVDRITIEGVTFHESGKDAFGKPLERDVTKHLNSSLGEQP
jgi:hypothetical protein